MTPLVYELSEQEWRVAAARVGWRLSLGSNLLARHLGPLAAFVLFILFAAILGLTGLIGRRAAEMALILAAAAYMIYRLWTRRRFLATRRAAEAWAKTRREAGPARLTLDETGLAWQAGAVADAWRFADGLEIEETGELVYVWPRRGEPLVWPTRADAGDYLVAVRQRLGARAPPAYIDDDD